MQIPAVKFHYATVCEDIRREDNGKLIYIGVYGAAIHVKELPATIVLRLAIPCQIKDPFEASIQFRVKYGRKPILAGQGEIRAALPGDSLFVVPQMILEHLDHPDVLHFAVRVAEGKWQTIRSMPVQLAPD